MYEYKAIVTKVTDGDTIHVSFDIGFGLYYQNIIRLYGINAPEKKGKTKIEGLKSTNDLKKLIEGKEVIVKTIKDKKEKYGRYLGVITVFDGKRDLVVNDWMVTNKSAVYKKY